MRDIVRMEFKRLFKTRKTYSIICVSIILSFLIAWSSVIVQRSSAISQDGTVNHLYGVEAIQYKKNSLKQSEGNVTSSNIADAISKYRLLHQEHKGNIPNKVYIEEVGPIFPMLSLLPGVFLDSQGEFSSRIFYELTPEEASNFYYNREGNQIEFWKDVFRDSPSIVTELIDREEQVTKPFYYSYYAGWDTAGEYLVILNIILMLLFVFFLSGVFSSDYQSNAAEVIRATKYGKSRLPIARIYVNISFIALLYIVSSSIYFITCRLYYGFEGLSTSVQFLDVFLPHPYSIGQIYLLSFLIGLISVLSTGMLTLFLSTRFHNSLAVMLFSVMILLLPIAAQFVLGHHELAKLVFCFLPSSGLIAYSQLLDINYVILFNKPIYSVSLSVLISIGVLILLIPVSVKSYFLKEM